jgi:eukaryotic-like serine/threonine-protein kinase
MLGPVLSRLQAALTGRYRVERELGAGGMATVYLAEDIRHRRRVALKVLHDDLGSHVGAERFHREIEIASGLQHPHILTVHDSGEADGLLWFTMPYVEGESLRDRLQRETQLPIDVALRIATEVADALDYAHRRGVIHRDIKPENILLSGSHALIADFGIGQVMGPGGGPRITGAGLAIGTPAYMSPEQATAERELDSRTDVYSLGVMLYEMLAGEPPFAGPTAQSVLAKRFGGEPLPIRRLRPGVPEGVEQAVTRALALAPADRFRTAGDLAAELTRTPSPRRVPKGLIIGAILLVLAGAAWLAFGRRPAVATAAPGAPRSLAVLPFVNIGDDSATTKYFSDGISEELIVALGRLPGLRVASRTSSFARGGGAGVQDIGRRLGVEALLEGSVRRDGSRVRVIARLVLAATDSLLWGNEYESGAEHVFALQDSIAHAIVGALRLTLAATPGEVLVAPATADAQAHDLYLQGRALVALRNEESLHRAIDAFRGALARDPRYAAAESGLADAFSFLSGFAAVAPGDAFPEARAAALRALALDSTIAEVHVSLGIISMFYEWDWEGGRRHLERAIALNPSLAQAHQFMAWDLMLNDRPDEAVREMTLAQRLDPLSLIINTRVGTILRWTGHLDEALAPVQHALALDSTFISARVELARQYAAAGRFADALAVIPSTQLGATADGGDTPACFTALAGRPAEARRLLAGLESTAKRQYVSQFMLAEAYVCLGDRDRTLQALDRGADERAFQLPFIKHEPLFAPLRADPRFNAVLQRMHLTPLR